MTNFTFGFALGVFLAAGIAVYHVWIMAKLSLALDKLEAEVKAEAAQAVMFFRKKTGL